VTHYAIIGDGGAGTTAAFYIRKADPKARIVIYSDDPNAAYYRAALTNYLMGELRESQLFATPPDFYQTNNIERMLGRVTSVDAKNSRFTFDDGNQSMQVAFDQLLISAGASPNKPRFAGADLPGVMTMRTLQDARTVMDQISAKQLKQAVVVGGGPLGIEWVQGLLHHGVKVIYLLRGDMFFGNALDRTGSDLVISRLRSVGVDVRLNEEIAEAVPGRDGRINAVKLKNSGDKVECQLVGAAIGISPNVAFLKDSGIDIPTDPKRGTMQGIKVDESMRTNISNIYAAGDIIYRTMGLWEPARLQGRVAGRNMAGSSASFTQTVHYNATRLYDLDFAGVGELSEKPGDQVLIDFPKGSGQVAYRKLIIRDNKLVGAIMLGQRKERVRKYGLNYQKLIKDGTDVSNVANDLLDPSFDLASWMASHEISEQINSARGVQDQPRALSNADMRMTNNAISADYFRKSVVPKAVSEAVLLYGNNRFPLKGVNTIGRKPGNDIVLEDADVSGQHAQIKVDGSVYILEDLQSTNGTFLNDSRISSPVRLNSGALIKLGGTQIQFVVGASRPVENLRMTSTGLPEVEAAPEAAPSDPVWGHLQIGNREFPLKAKSLNIGRDTKADITLDDGAVSYLHAQLVRQGNDTFLRDLGSSNGTFVNGTRISVPHKLTTGDSIKLGNSSFLYRAGSSFMPIPEKNVESKPTPAPKRETPSPTPVKQAQPVVEEKPKVVEKATPKPEPVAVSSSLEFNLSANGGPLSGNSFKMDRSPLNIGRGKDNHIVLNDGTVSWKHASFKQEDMKWNIRDLGSSNHTFLNGEQLEPNKPYQVNRGDKIKIGETILEVV